MVIRGNVFTKLLEIVNQFIEREVGVKIELNPPPTDPQKMGQYLLAHWDDPDACVRILQVIDVRREETEEIRAGGFGVTRILFHLRAQGRTIGEPICKVTGYYLLEYDHETWGKDSKLLRMEAKPV